VRALREEIPSMTGCARRSPDGRSRSWAVNLRSPNRASGAFMEQVPMDFTVLLDRDTSVAKPGRRAFCRRANLVRSDGRIRYSVLGEIDWTTGKGAPS